MDNSGFEGTQLAALLGDAGVARIFIGGLATDYCVLNTVVDALELGFGVVLLTGAMRGINLQPGDEEAALATMTGHGAVPGPGVLTAAARRPPAPQRHP